VRTTEDMKRLLRAGADTISVNSAAVERPELISEGAERFGSQCIVLSMDVLWNGEYYEVVTHGGRIRRGMDAIKWAQRGEQLGAGELCVNSIDADGTKNGYEIRLTRMISEATTIPIIASGGAGNVQHMEAALTEGKADAVLAASIFHFGTVRISEAKEYLRSRGIAVRLEQAA
jgi:cyclase